MIRSPHALDFARARERFVAGTDDPRAYLERCIETISSRDAQVHAFVTLGLERAREASDAATERYRNREPLSALDGMPVGVKDIMDTADLPTQMGSPLYTGFQPRWDAACVQALRAGGAIVVGKTVTTAFAFGITNETRNPLDPGRTPGGSSSGSAAAVGTGMLPAALGTQTQGSTLRPASFCGVFGFKPTHGALPMQGVHPISLTHDHLGVIAGRCAMRGASLRTSPMRREAPHRPDCTAQAPGCRRRASRGEYSCCARRHGRPRSTPQRATRSKGSSSGCASRMSF